MPRENFKSFAESWSEKVLPSWKPSSAASARHHLAHHLYPAFGELKLVQINTENIQGFVSRLVSEGRSRAYIMNIVITLASVLRSAARWGQKVHKVDYEALVFPVAGAKQKGRSYTEEQVMHVLKEAPEPDRTIYALAAMTGMRSGEMAALSWSDIDLQAGIIQVRRSCFRGTMTSVKSKAGNRTIPMPDALIDILVTHGKRTSMDGLLFKGRKGNNPINMSDFASRHLHPLLKRLGIPRAGWHAFRHAQATALVNSGANPKIAQAQLGHSDVRVTLELYSHLVSTEHRKAVSRVAERFLPKASNED